MTKKGSPFQWDGSGRLASCETVALAVRQHFPHSILGRDIPSSDVLPVMFLSRATTNAEKKYGSTEAEVAAVVWAVRKLRKMIQSNSQPANILTDHAATRGIVKHTSLNTLDLAKANLKLANAANWLSQFELNIFHIPGTLNVVPDALSRLPTFEQDDLQVQEDPSDELADIWAYTWNEGDTTWGLLLPLLPPHLRLFGPT
ncbi:hypothetical protein VTK56DRAFT_844 [Thermocarpiscus australiensis]